MSKKRRSKKPRIELLNLGCNQRPLPSDRGVHVTNVDVDDYGKAEITKVDLEKTPWPFEDNTFDVVRAYDLIEHLQCPITTMNEIWRVLKPGGLADILVPSTDGRGAFQDPTHIHNPLTGTRGSFWNQNSFMYYAMVPERPEDPESPLVPHPWKALYPSLIKAAFLCDIGTSAPNDTGIIYVIAKLTKVCPNAPDSTLD